MLVVKSVEGIRGLTGVKQQIKTGDTVSVKVIKHLSGNSWQISLKGKLLPVVSQVPLQEESTVKAQAFWKGKTLQLRVMVNNHDSNVRALSQLSAKTGIPVDRASQAIVEALQRSEMPLIPELIARLYKQLKQYGPDKKQIARLLVLFADKGLEAPEKFIETVLPYFPQEGQGERRKEQQKRKKRDKESEKKHVHENEHVTAPSPEKVREILKQNLLTPSPLHSSSLLLFNHIKGEHDNWIIIPLSITIDNQKIIGSLRMRLIPDTSRADTILCSFATDSGIWRFSLHHEDEGYVCRTFCSPEALRNEGNKILESFSEKIRKLGVKIVDTIRECNEDDGFSFEHEMRYKNINTVV